MRGSILVVAFVVGVFLGNSVAADESEALWRIGAADGLPTGLALAPDGYGQFADDGFFIAGRSDAARDWPYVHPGPSDAWAGNRAHTYTVVFSLSAPPSGGLCRLDIQLVDTHKWSPPVLRVALNGAEKEIALPPGAEADTSIQGHPESGKPHAFKVKWPDETLQEGANTLTITTQEGSWMLYDSLSFHASGATLAPVSADATLITKVTVPPVLVESDGQLMRPIQCLVHHLGPETEATVLVNGEARQSVTLHEGVQSIDAMLPDVEASTAVTVAFARDGETLASQETRVEPVRKWTVYLLHHTHLDIGYTHHQSEVEQLQWEHMDKALALIEATKAYPEPSRFVWLPEGLWAVDSYLDRATPETRAAFIQAVKQGDIGLDALYGNQLTALCTTEELIELMGYGRRLAHEEGLTINSAMITDVPGYTWGIVPALAKSGVKYFSVGPNRGHRIGFTLTEWGDKPFYWVSPSGAERVLTWIHGEGYSWFHGGVSAAPEFHTKYESKIFGYLQSLQERADYPYDIAILRYNIGGDNGPPDEHLPEFIRQWNAKYAYPKLSFATTGEAFGAFEAKYGGQLAEVRGDFTPYWEDGAASSALETVINRAAAERIAQASAIAVMTGAPFDFAVYEKAWREVILYDEHTWGAHNSISEPQSEFALQQWATKQAFALEAEKQSRALLATALSPVAGGEVAVAHVGLFNTESWPRTELVLLPADWKCVGDRVEVNGAPQPTQRLADGRLAFVARDVPALGAATANIVEGAALDEGKAHAESNTLSNGLVTVVVHPETGVITELRLGDGPNLAGDDGFGGLNAYRYVAGRIPDNAQPSGTVTIDVVEAGPVVAALRITSDAPGCEKLTREIRVVDGLPEVYITDTLDKTAVYGQEGVHIAFPFDVPGGTIRMDVPFAVVRPNEDQLKGSCKNYFTVQRWVDVSNEDYGVTWATPDAPLIEVGGITTDGRQIGWIEELASTSTILSYVMNNYWETNYKAAQEGPTTFRFVLRPHAGYDKAAAHRFGMAQRRPLVASPLSQAFHETNDLAAKNAELVVTNMMPAPGGGAIVLRLFNAGDASVNVLEAYPSLAEASVSTLDGDALAVLDPAQSVAPDDFITLRCTPKFLEGAK
jgi:hypothetical protein